MIHAAILLFLAPLLSDDAWNRLDKEARALSGEMGEPARKSALAAELATEDSERVARLLLEIAEDARQRHEKAEKRRERAEEDFRRLTRALRKQKGRRTSLSDDSRWTSKRDELEEAKSAVETEETFLRILRRTIGGLRSPEACAALVDPKSARYRKSPFVRRGILDALWDQKGFEADILAFARDKDLPEQRARVLDWIARKRVTAGFDVAMECMRAKEPAVVRSAVAALQSLDDPRCVPALVTCRRKAEGQLAEELEFALHHFTGKKFFGAGAGDAYGAWWRAEGEAWLAEKTRKRYGDPERKGSAHFYGIPTRSERIVFVLDRSLSMKEPVPQAAVTTGKSDRVPGETRMEVAKNQLARSIRGLQPNVEFAVVFYSHEVHRWREKMAKATPDNKKDAIEWFMELKPVGSTMMFDALKAALQFGPQGADTIFLLSDGAPSSSTGRDLLEGDELEEAVKGFLDANRSWRFVVHTIGVGPRAHRALMERLAKETGGTYRAVAQW